VNKRILGAITLLASLVGLAIGKVGVQSYFDHRRTAAFERALADVSKQMNEGLPKQADNTRLDSTAPGPGLRFTCVYTVFGVSDDSIDTATRVSAMRALLVSAYKTSPQFALFRAQGVEMHSVYRDTEGKQIAEIVVSPKDLQ
jgi:hypothetical protein